MLSIPQMILDDMLSHARREAPDECCGLLAGVGLDVTALYQIANLPADDPAVADMDVPSDRRLRYVMDPKAQLAAFKKMRQDGQTLLAIYHSHPHSPAYPSATDVRLAVYPDVRYIILSLCEEPAIRAFRIAGQEVAEEAITPIV